MARRPSAPRLHRHFRRPALIALTTGDPAGIGPEVILKALRAGALPAGRQLVVIGDLPVFETCAQRLRLPLPPWRALSNSAALHAAPERLLFWDMQQPLRLRPGRSSATMGRAALRYLQAAIELWRAKQLAALVTGPLTKWAVAEHLPGFFGQTEWLTEQTGARHVLMAFLAGQLRVVVLTRHIPLQHVARALTKPLLRASLQALHRALQDHFRIARPRIALCGLNPHAGEAGHCGKEEQTIMLPVLRALNARGLRVEGPFAADGFFAAAARDYDAIVCAYHDQGLIPFKMQARDTGCQASLGLPFIRTSPDHGSALDIAGKGCANAGSMRYALAVAARLSAC